MKVRLGSVSLRSPSPSPSPSPSSICLPSVSRRTGILYDLHEIVDAIVILTGQERRIDRLVGFTREDRSKRVGSESGLTSGPESGRLSGHTRSRVLSGVSRVPLGSESGPQKIEKSGRKTREDPSRVAVGSSRVRRKRGIAVSLCHRAPKRTIRVGE